MKIAILTFVATLIACVLAQAGTEGLPDCAKGCLGSSFGGCKLGDIACICSNKDYLGSIACCISDKCSDAEKKATIAFATSLCSSAGVTVPQEATCSTATGSASTATNTAASNGTSTRSSATQSVSAAATGGAQHLVGSGIGAAGAAMAALAFL
ncbi:MAG: hypothetical protein M1812_000452 [Candelaria pacifica]|nr:MAG: hypothetical protein M1812_000452 [Candelaria pacifica]